MPVKVTEAILEAVEQADAWQNWISGMSPQALQSLNPTPHNIFIRSRLGDAALSLVSWEFHTNGDDIARISIDPADFPVYERKDDAETFWNRTQVGTIAVTDDEERARIIARRWGS